MSHADERDGEILRRLIHIDNKTDSMGDSLAWLVQANAPHLKTELVKAFGNSRRRVQVYLLLNGSRNVDDIANLLQMKGQNVSIELTWLRRKRLIHIVEAGRGGKKYRKKFFDAVIGLS